MLQAHELAQAIASEWEYIGLSLAGEQEGFEAQLLPLLRQLDAQSREPQAAIKAILGLFQAFPPAYEFLRRGLQQGGAFTTKSAAARATEPEKSRCVMVPVFFATNRARVTTREKFSFGAERGDPSYGFAEVSIPDDHRMGRIERPKWWKLQFREDEGKHVIVQSLHTATETEFTTLAGARLEKCARKEILVFVHGYNVGFRDALARCAQIAYDLHFEGTAMLYSWPSEDTVVKYLVDGGNAEWSQPHFAAFLQLIREQLGAEAIHIVAHSMGNRLLAGAIKDLSAPAANIARVRQIVFAAPDVDAATFTNRAAAFQGRAERFTLYASSEDKALKLSKVLHKYPRAGESGNDLVVVAGVDTIDASAVNTDLLGHSYFGDTQTMLSDLFYLIREGTPPASRFGLSSQTRYGTPYWLFGVSGQ